MSWQQVSNDQQCWLQTLWNLHKVSSLTADLQITACSCCDSILNFLWLTAFTDTVWQLQDSATFPVHGHSRTLPSLTVVTEMSFMGVNEGQRHQLWLVLEFLYRIYFFMNAKKVRIALLEHQQSTSYAEHAHTPAHCHAPTDLHTQKHNAWASWNTEF